MALSTAKFEAIHNKTGSDLAAIKANFDNGKHLDVVDFPAESAIIYQIQKMQEELNYLRGIIDTNNDKVSMTLGTTGSTALAGDTTTISTTQANEITASTTLGAKLNVVTRVADVNKSTAITFGEFTATTVKGVTTYSLPITVVETTIAKGGNTTITKTATLTLT